MNPWLLLGLGAAWVASVAAAGAGGFKAGQDHELSIQAREDRVAVVAGEAAASAAAGAISKITVKHQTIRQEVEREIQTRDVFRDPDCRTGDDLVRKFNAAIPGAQPASDPSAVPAPGTGH